MVEQAFISLTDNIIRITNNKSNNINSTQKMKKRVFFLLVAALVMPFAMKAQVNSSVHIDSTISACDSYTWSVTGQTYYTNTVVTHVSGDTLYILDLTINPSVTNVVSDPVVGGCTYTWGTTTYDESGTYTQTFRTSKNCDSTVTINLTLSESAAVTRDITACLQYTYKNETYSESGTYNIIDSSNANCDSLITLNLTIRQLEQKSFDTTVVACERTEWIWSTDVPSVIVTANGTVITSEAFSTSSGSARRAFHPRTAERCFDSLVTVTFNIKRNDTMTYTHSACDYYEYFFSLRTSDTTSIDTLLTYTFSKSDTIRFVRRAVNGCDSVLVTKITINKSPVITISGDLRVAPGSNCTLYVSSDQANTRFTWQDGSHDTIYTRNNVTENFDTYVTGVNNTTGCEHTSYVTVLANQSINGAEDNAISVYPNPASAMINISSSEAVKSVTIFNVAGQQVMSVKGSNSVDLSSVTNGTYVVRVDLESGKVATRTIVVAK
jgi:hypothetical protein